MKKLILGALLLLSTFGFSQDTSEIECNQPISIFPNPSIDVINIKCEGTYNAYLYNSLGELLESTTTTTIETSKYSSGLYFIIFTYNCGETKINEFKTFFKN